MSFMSILQEAEGHLSEYEGIATEIKTAAADGLAKLTAHRDAVKAAIANAVATGERAVSSITATVEAAASTAKADVNSFLGKST